jgi:hypothetical protein
MDFETIYLNYTYVNNHQKLVIPHSVSGQNKKFLANFLQLTVIEDNGDYAEQKA